MSDHRPHADLQPMARPKSFRPLLRRISLGFCALAIFLLFIGLEADRAVERRRMRYAMEHQRSLIATCFVYREWQVRVEGLPITGMDGLCP